MDVEFRISEEFDRSVGEHELERLTADERLGLARRDGLRGVLVLSDEGQPSVRISDEIEPWIQNLCYGAVPKLLAGEPEEIPYFSKPGVIRLEPDADLVHVSGDRVEAAVFPRRELALALFECGDRFARWASGPSHGETPGGVSPAPEGRPAARSALQAAGLTPSEPD